MLCLSRLEMDSNKSFILSQIFKRKNKLQNYNHKKLPLILTPKDGKKLSNLVFLKITKRKTE